MTECTFNVEFGLRLLHPNLHLGTTVEHRTTTMIIVNQHSLSYSMLAKTTIPCRDHYEQTRFGGRL